jgi:hypothetical protein
MGLADLQLDSGAIGAFCREHGIRRLAVFGAALREDLGPGDEVDVLVDFAGPPLTGPAFFALQDELAALIGHPVDLNTLGFLSPNLRERILREAEDVYVAPR